MIPEPKLNHHGPPNDVLTDLILDHGENMLILAYVLTHNADRANKIVANILFELYLRGGLTEEGVPVHTFLYTLVKVACEDNSLSTK